MKAKGPTYNSENVQDQNVHCSEGSVFDRDAKGDALLNKRELADRLNLKSTRAVDALVARRSIPVIRLGHKTTRFSWPAVKAALERMTVAEVC